MGVIVRFRKHWDVKCPPTRKKMVGGMLLPTVRGALHVPIKKRRRLCIEVHSRDDDDEYKIVEPPLEGLPESVEDLRPGDTVMLLLLKPGRHSEDDDETTAVGDEEVGGGWVVNRKYDLDDVEEEALSIHGTSWETKLGRGSSVEVKEFQFGSEQALQGFLRDMNRLRALEKEMAAMRIQDFQKASSDKQHIAGSSSLIDEDVNLLVEIVSATDLPAADFTSSDPYVVVWLGKKEIHRTKRISKTTDPIWPVHKGSLFILSATAQEFFQSAGLTFIVKDYDALGSNEVLGKVTLSHKELLDSKGERMEYKLKELYDGYDPKKAVYPPKLNIRVRPASKKDFMFIKRLAAAKGKKQLGVYADAAFVAPLSHSVNRLKRETKHGDRGIMHRVKPGPDPDRPEEETKWLTKDEIEAEHLKPSTKWVEIGSGQAGRIYLEVLRCDSLPNLDKGTLIDKTDAYCSIIYEDAVANTDVINDELSPRWMPWSQRAFIFHVNHPSSQVLLGVFDYDTVTIDPIGRISIDMTNFSPKTDYVLTYDLYRSVLDEVREPMGTITVRLRLEIRNFRNVVLASLGPPPLNYVNMAKKYNFQQARFVAQGEENLHQLDMEALKSYGNELQGYSDLLYYVEQALLTVILWRGHWPVNLCGCKFKLAIHSVVAFVLGVFLVEDYDLFPSFLLFSIAWFFLATNELRQCNPSPWHQSATFGEMWYALIFGWYKGKEVVAGHPELQPLIQEFEKAVEKRREKQKDKEAKSQRHDSQMDAYFAQEEKETAEDEENVDRIETKTGGVSLNPLKSVLLPIQEALRQVCIIFRVVRSVVTWDESVYAFVITNACLIGGLVLLFVPWGWIIRWVLRIFVWTFLGPWMKLVDILIVRKLQADGDNFVKRFERMFEQRSLVLLMRKRAIMMRKEEAVKLRAMKRYMFGRYVLRVPQFKEYRYPDRPRPKDSSASPHDEGYSSVRISERKHGQRLVGHMVPVWGDDENDAILTTEDKAQEGLLSRVNPTKFFARK